MSQLKISKNVFLCGFMGCGKSTVGKLLAKKLSCQFIDMDDYIVEKTGMLIPEIFAQKGEQFFRQTETNAIKDFVNITSSPKIIACGGGAMLKKINSKIANKNGIVVYINVDFETCYSRIKDDKNRPIVQNNSMESLHNIYNERVPIYIEHSAISVDGSNNPQDISDEIFKLI